MKELTREQKKIIYIAAVVVAFIFLFWLFIYLPVGRKLRQLKEELKNAQAQIVEINHIAQGRDIRDIVIQLNKQLDIANNLLPQDDEVAVNFLSQSARAIGVNIKNMNISGQKKLDFKIAGRFVQELPFSLELAADFKAIGEYLAILQNNPEVLIRVKQIDIKGSGLGHPELNANIRACVYLLPED